MKLELKHLSAYLPYKVMVSNLHYLTARNGIGGIEHILTTKSKPYKLRLRPLSEFEYDHIAQIKEHLGIGQWCDYYDQYFDAWFDDPCSVDKLVLQAPYVIMQYFLENHYDVFNLIPQGLAISIHDINS